MPHNGIILMSVRGVPFPIKFGVRRPSAAEPDLPSFVRGRPCRHGFPDRKETAPGESRSELRPFHKVPRERAIDTFLMWVSEPSIPIKICFRGPPQFVANRHRAGLPSLVRLLPGALLVFACPA